jgi:hypothetical protein
VNESLEQPFVSEKKTIELCAEQIRRGVRCTLPRGHDAEHEYHDPHGGGIFRWLTR